MDEAQNALADLIALEQDEERREFLMNLEIVAPCHLPTLIRWPWKNPGVSRLFHARKTITSFYNRTRNIPLGNRDVSPVTDNPVVLPQGMTHVSYSPSGKQWLGWYTHVVFNPDTCAFTNANTATYLTVSTGERIRLKLPFSVPFQIVWNASETQVAILGKPNDSVKLILFSLETLSWIAIDDFGKSASICVAKAAFSPNGQFLFVQGIHGLVFFYDTTEGQRIAEPFNVTGNCKGNPWAVSTVGCVFLCGNVLYLFHIAERKLHALITFVANPDQVFFTKDIVRRSLAIMPGFSTAIPVICSPHSFILNRPRTSDWNRIKRLSSPPKRQGGCMAMAESAFTMSNDSNGRETMPRHSYSQ